MSTFPLSWSPPWMATAPPPKLPSSDLRIACDFPAWMPAWPGMTPRQASEVRGWWPLNPSQQEALFSPAELLLFGGQSGGGKTDFLVGDAMQEFRIPSFRGLLLRESLGEFDQIGDRMERAYLPLKARYRHRTGGGQWIFPSGARIRFGYLASDRDLSKYRGNPYSWLGIDESGLHPLCRVQQMIAWLASVDLRLRVRGRFTSNPGGVGHGWQMAVFLRNRCPLHYPPAQGDAQPMETSVVPGKVYKGASWGWPPSPANLVHKTTAFFPASVTDNPLYGQEKVDSLRSQTPEIQMQLLHGCWCNAESLYFGFLTPEWRARRGQVGEQWWWNHFISIDYGYGNSAAAAGLFAVDDYGRVFGVAEMTERKMGAADFARKVAAAWIDPAFGDSNERRRMQFVTMDPHMNQHHDVGESTFEMMAKVFDEHGVASIESHVGPADNAQKLYSGLAGQTMVVTDGMPDTFNSVATRTIDKRKAVKKIHGDAADDLYDMVAYAYNTWLVNAVKPAQLKLLDKVKQMREKGTDETSIARFILHETRRINEKTREASEGLPLGRAGQRPRR